MFMNAPDRGDLVFLDFNPQAGHEQAGHRPALVLSPKSFNMTTGFAIFCPITNQKKGYPFEVDLPSGLPITGVILADQVKSLDWRARNLSIRAQAPDTVVDDVLLLIRTILGIS